MYRLIAVFGFYLSINCIQVFLPSLAVADGMTLAQAESIVLAEDLSLVARKEQSLALKEDATFAAQLPDPQLFLAGANLPVDSWDLDQEPMTQLKFGVRQAFPAGDTRALRQQKITEQSWQVDAERKDAALRLRQQLRSHWLMLSGWSHSHQLLSHYRPVFEQLVDVTLSYYKVGKKHQQDYLRAKLLLGQLDNRLLNVERKMSEGRARLSRWLGEDAYGELVLSWPESWTVPSSNRLDLNHPRVVSSDHQVKQQSTAVDLAVERYKPNWGLEMSYGHREADDMRGDRLSDFFSAMVTVDLPLFTANRQDRQFSAEKHRLEATRISRADLLLEMNAMLATNMADIEQLNRSVQLYQEQLLLLGEQQAEAALQAYQSDAADFADVMQSTSLRLELELEYQKTLQGYYQSLADVYYLLPGEGRGYE
ncbi:MAG: TolC family protein [Porticoccus sp.]